MPVTTDEIAAAIRELIRRDTVPLSQLPDLLESYGHLEGEYDKRAKCRAIAAMMRKILEDSEVAELLRATLEVHALRSVQGLFDAIRTGPMLTEGYWNEHDARVREADKRVVQLRHATQRKLALLSHLAQKLTDLKCDDEFDLPRLRDDLYPALQLPPSP